ncbi:MAG: TVP38/TMEM64 family protein [Alphaproteobacteria bacterium]|nr:TVP38/TMEM64 family protein [Alphaproteobacteria bacterium]MBF0128499.1 TVP38/TMEM64 family protein [Alphaproteobacteria bacterium]
MRFRLIGRGLVLIATLAGIGFLIETQGLGHLLDESWIDSRVRGQGVSGEALFVVVGALFTAIGMPRQMVCFLGGYAFGFALGSALSLLASVLGCATAFFYARWLGRSLVQSRFAHRIRRIDDFLRDNPLSMTLLIRLLPVGSNLITNLAGGVSAVGGGAFLVGSGLGYLPQTAIFALLGSGIQVDPAFRISLSVALFAASAVLGVWIYRRFRHGKHLDDDIENAIDSPES